MIGYVYSPGQKTTPNQDLGLKVATPVGTLVGQLLFGWLADIVGRKRMCMSSPELTTPRILNTNPDLLFTHRWRRTHDHHHRYLRSGSRW